MSQYSKMQKIERIAEVEQFTAEKFKADIEFAKLPPWIQENLEGDRMSDGSDSGVNNGDREEQNG